MAEIYNRSATTDKLLILNIREAVVQPFSAPNWLDLRFAAYLSVTRPDPNDDDPLLNNPGGTMPETIIGSQLLQSFYYIGLASENQTSQMIAFTNLDLSRNGNGVFTASDLGTTNSGPYYWRPYNSTYGSRTFAVWDNNQQLAGIASNGVFPHFYQSADPGNTAPAGYYCSMIGFRMTRPTPTSRTITVWVPIPLPSTHPNSTVLQWTNAPTAANLLAAMDPWPSGTGQNRQVGPFTISTVPNCLYFYWPFRKSRLRISAMGILRAA